MHLRTNLHDLSILNNCVTVTHSAHDMRRERHTVTRFVSRLFFLVVLITALQLKFQAKKKRKPQKHWVLRRF